MQRIHDLSQLDWERYIQEDDLVLWGQAQAEPLTLTQNLMQNCHKISNFSVFLGISNFATCSPEHAAYIDFSSYCGAGSNRLLAKSKQLEIIPSHYSAFCKILWPDVVIIQLSAPNERGQYSFALGQDYPADAIRHARTVIAEVNANLPWTYASDYLTEQDLDLVYESNRKFTAETAAEPNSMNTQIAAHVASLIPNGATLQIGIGTLPETVLNALSHHQNLGIHSGIISDGVAKLMQSGVINNSQKAIDSGITITGLINGSEQLHDFVNLNSNIQLRASSYTHNPQVLSQLDNLIAVNSAIEVDLTGQVNAEIANGTYVGAVGGALDFIRAANQSAHGRSIIALPSAGKNFTRIVSQLSGPVSTPRSDAGFFVTEYGIADLRGLSLSARANKMISIAHPDFREQLTAEAKSLSLI
ncbi:acetyl-CoA hydrolase/transferase family protein [Acinetobacter sp. ANC 3813]|uniref:acetyl-CoA hydrolase/transferase family protein n=1 Tax=Acinetobacter sp. ANC 3813 TaxID=1977873 RepID=UPI000A32DD41|nr:acetyl-CoA hydrolase/transferase C-terminal domain-containing protein [Acinetobacter sp. ANC 3813]OTG91289.1 acetyl-CoA hydrolase [Acinetobacter sp. ANC 3813]